MLTILCSAKGSPGATTSALALAAAWPGEAGALVIEADPAGGDLGIRLRPRGGAIPTTPTVATLAADAREADSDVTAKAIALNETIRVVPGFQSPAQGRGLTALWSTFAGVLQRSETDTLVDIGRLTLESVTMPLVDVADVIVVVVSPTIASLVHARELATQLQGRPAVVQPLIVTRGRDAAADRGNVDEVFADAGLLAAASVHLAWDVATVAALEAGESPAGRALSRSKLLRSAHVAADAIVEHRGAGLIREAL